MIAARRSSDSLEDRPPGWMTRLPITAMNLYGSSPAISPDASFVTILTSARHPGIIVIAETSLVK